MKKMLFKYMKQLQRNTLIYPSEIHFLNELEFKIDDALLDELNSKIDTLDKEQYPKLQITQKNGYYFCLNNTMLFLFQNLQQKKKVQEKIACEIISLNKVPEHLQKEMILHKDYRTTSESSSDSSCCSGCDTMYNDTITTIISSNRNRIVNRHYSADSDNNQAIEQTYTTSLINNDDRSEHSSLSSELSDDFFNDNKDALSNCSLICNYCDQKFSDSKLLRKHKLKKQHFVCICGERFKNLAKLEQHKHTQEHWSDEID